MKSFKQSPNFDLNSRNISCLVIFFGISLSAFLMAGCSGLTGTENVEMEDIPVHFLYELAHGESGNTEVTAGNRSIILQGFLTTPSPCHSLKTDLSLEKRVLTLTILSQTHHGFCIGILGQFRYKAFLQSLPSGPYLFQVQHENDISGKSETIIEKSVIL